jgi:hypothetical protein
MNEKDLTTHCGIYCGDCPRYRAKFSDLSGELLEEFEQSNFSKLAKVIATKSDRFRQYTLNRSLRIQFRGTPLQ